MQFNKDRLIGTAKDTGGSLAWLGIGVLVLILGILLISAVHTISPATDVTGLALAVLIICMGGAIYGSFKFR